MGIVFISQPPLFLIINLILTREERLGQLVGVEPGDVVAAVENLVAEAAQLRTEVPFHCQPHQYH